MKREYLKLIDDLQNMIENTKECDEKKIMLLAINSYKETLENNEITDKDLISYLKNIEMEY